MKYKYGISEVEFEIMLKSQDNKCLICGLEFIEPCVDHCHKTGKIRSLLCQKCNTALGLFDDNPKLLKIATKYLESNNNAYAKAK